MSGRVVRARVTSEGRSLPLSPAGLPESFGTDFSQGSAFFVHRPPLGTEAPSHSARLRKNGADYSFEFQIQCRFKAAPRGTVFMSAELRNGPMQLNLVTRALCRVLLGFIQKKAASRGIELRYSFGDRDELPNITFPVLAADRVIVSDEPTPLPIDTDEDRGTWRWEKGKLMPIDRSNAKPEDGGYLTVMFATSYVDLNSWTLTGIPGVRNLDLTQFWGSQALHVAFFEDDAALKRRIFFELELFSVFQEENAVEDVAPAAKAQGKSTGWDAAETVVEPADAAVEEAEDMSEDHGERLSFYSARDENSDDGQHSSGEEEPEPGDEDWDTRSKISSTSKGIVDRLNGNMAAAFRSLEEEPTSAWTLAIPWYFVNGAGDLWWCINFRGRACWRHNSQLRQLCLALGGEDVVVDGKASVHDLEAARRTATRLLQKGSSAPGLLEEFTSAAVDLSSLLSGEVRPRSQAIFLGVVEAEGRIAERYARLQNEQLRWRLHVPGGKRMEEVCLDVKKAVVTEEVVAGALAVAVRSVQRGWVFLTKDAAHRAVVMESLRRCSVEGANGAEASPHLQETWSSLRRNVARFLDMVPVPPTVHHVQQRAAEAATSVQLKAAATMLRNAAWHDPLMRWPKNRIVVNNAEPCLEAATTPALQLSASLLREAVAAQGAPEGKVAELTARSGALKAVSLAELSEQDLWCFWVNVFHCLIIHAQLVAGQPTLLPHIVSFFNHCSYVVAGHVFSLAEIEHCVLRKNLTKPRIRLVRSILRIWPRSDEELESRPCMNAPYSPAACFGCRGDWRLNLVLNAGNFGSAEAVPIFEKMSEPEFEEVLKSAIECTLRCCGSSSKDAIELPYTLCRYRDDAPAGSSGESAERRWARALLPGVLQANSRVSYRKYAWSMRPRLMALPENI